MTKQHLNELYSKGIVCKRTNIVKIISAALLLILGIVLFVSADKLGATSDAMQMAAYLVGGVAVIGGIWVVCAGTTKMVDGTTNETFSKKVFFVKSSDIDNIVNSFRQMGIKDEIKNFGGGAYRVVMLSTKNSLYVAFYQYVPHEYANASEIISVDSSNVPSVISAVECNCI